MGLIQKMEKKNAATIKAKVDSGGYDLTEKEKKLLKKYYPNSNMNWPMSLYENIHAKRKRIKAGSGERMKKKGEKGRPTAKDFDNAAKTAKKLYPNQN